MRMPRWTKVEIKRLRKWYATLSTSELAEKLGRSEKAVSSKAHSLGLAKSEAYLENMGRKNRTGKRKRKVRA